MADPQDALKRKANDDFFAAPTGSDLTAPQVPLQRLSRVEEAEQGLVRTAKRSFDLSTPGAEGSGRAMDLLRRIQNKPEDIPPGPGPEASYLDQAKQLVREAGVAFLPEQVRGDQRAPTAAETAQMMAHQTVENALSPWGPGFAINPFGLNPAAQAIRNAAPGVDLRIDRTNTPEEEKGLPEENATMWAMRVLGTTIMAIPQETIERLPSPDVVGTLRTAANPSANLGDIATAFFSPSTVGKQVLGIEPGELQRVRMGTGFDWAEGVLERVEQGAGMGRDFGESVARNSGEENRWVGTLLGTAVDTLTNWEGAMVKGPAVLASLYKRMGTLAELAPDASLAKRALDAVAGNEVDLAKWLGPKWVGSVERGERSIDELPGWWRARAEEVAQTQEGSSLHEVATDDNLAHGMQPPVEDVAHRTALQQAREQAIATRQQVTEQLAVDHVRGLEEHDRAIEQLRQRVAELADQDRRARASRAGKEAMALSKIRGQEIVEADRAREAARVEAQQLGGQLEQVRAERRRVASATSKLAGEKPPRPPAILDSPYGKKLLEKHQALIQDMAGSPAATMPRWLEADEKGIVAYEVARLRHESRFDVVQEHAAELARLEQDLLARAGDAHKRANLPRGGRIPEAPTEAATVQGEGPELLEARKQLEERVVARGKFERRKPTNRDVDEMMELSAGQEPGVFRRRRTVNRTGPVDDTRPLPPEFDRPATSASDWWRKIQKYFEPGAYPEGGYRFQRHMGWNRMLVEGTETERLGHAGVPIETVERPEYVLRSAKGDIVEQGTLSDVIHTMTDRKRMRDGDEIWWQDKRPVARWSKTVDEGRPRIQLGSDYLFTSPLERRLIQRFRETDPRGTPLMLRGLKAKETETLEQIAGRQLADILTDAPAGQRATTRTGQILQQALELGLRDRLPSRVYKPLPNGALAPLADHGPILKRAAELLPLSQDRAAAVLTGQKLTAAEEAKLAALASRYGVPHTPGTLTLGEWNAIRDGAVTEAGSHLADVRFRLRGTPVFFDRWWSALSNAHLDKKKWGRVGEAVVKRGPMAAISKAFLEDKLADVPVQVRTVLRETRTQLERVADDTLLEFRSLPKDASPANRMLTIAKKYDAVHPSTLELAERVVGDHDIPAIQAEWKGPRPAWLDDTDTMIWHHGFNRWREDVADQAAGNGRRWVLAHLNAAGKDVAATDLATEVKQLPAELQTRVYREVFEDGNLDGPALHEALAAVHQPGLKTDPSAAMVAYTLQSKAESVVSGAVDRLLREGIAVRPTDARKPAIQAMLFDDHYVWDAANKRRVYRYPMSQITFAENKLRDWGIEPGSGASIKSEVSVGTRKVSVPDFIADDLRRLVAGAQLDSRMVWNNKAIDTLMRAFKEWTTHGYIVPNPPFFAGQMLSVVPTLITTRGLGGTVEAGATFLRHPVAVGQLAMRLAGHGAPVFRAAVPEGELIRIANGGLTSMDELERVARATGLNDTHASYETATQLRDVLARDGADYSILDPRRLKLGAARLQDTIRTLGGAFDQLGRLSVYLSEAKQGVPLEQAAQHAREAMLDFRNMTEWEAQYMRRVFTFYAFMRKTVDASMKALFHDPARVLGQMRFANQMLRRGLKPLEQGGLTDDDAQRLVLYTDDTVTDDKGRPDPRYVVNRLTSTPTGPGEALGMARMLTWADPQGLAQSLTPIAQTLLTEAMGHPLTGDYDSPLSNKVPPALLDTPVLGEWVRRVFRVGAVPLKATDDPELSNEAAKQEFGSGQPAVWAAGGDRSYTPEEQAVARKRWQQFLQWFSRPLGPTGTLETMAEGLGLEPHSPDITQEQSTLAALLGLRWRPVMAEGQAKNRALQEQATQLGKAQDALLLPGESRSR